MPIEVLAPEIAAMLALRAALGVRNSAHTIAKMLQPFAGSALRIVSVTHPDYLTRMREFFTRHDTGVLALRGAEGEAVAHPRREPAIEPRVVDHREEQRYELWLGDGLAGEIEYASDATTIALIHTEISPALEGKGLAVQLVSAALDDIRTRRRRDGAR